MSTSFVVLSVNRLQTHAKTIQRRHGRNIQIWRRIFGAVGRYDGLHVSGNTPRSARRENLLSILHRGLRFRQRPILNAQAGNLGEVNQIPG
jgi:hypothetical protein